MLAFISFWRAAAVVLNDMGSSAFYAGAIAEHFVGKTAPWFVLAIMLLSYAVRSVYIESSSMVVRGGVYRVVKEAMGATLAKFSVSALMFDYILTGPISGVSAGLYLTGLLNELLHYAHAKLVAKIARNAIAHNRQQGFAVHPHMHDSLAVAAFLDPSLLKFEDYYVDVETAGELTAGETVGYSPIAGDLRRNPAAQKQATLSMPIRGSAPSLASAKTSPVLRDKFVPNAKVAVDVNSTRFFELLIGRLAEKSVKLSGSAGISPSEYRRHSERSE